MAVCQGAGEGRASFKVNDAALMHQEKEDVSWLNKNLLATSARTAWCRS